MPVPMELPPEEVEKLRVLRTEDYEQFKARIRDLRNAGWTYASLAAPFLSPRATAQAWSTRALSEEYIPVADDIPQPPRASEYVEVFMRPTVPESMVPRLRELALSVRAIRGWTLPDAQPRLDAEELELTIIDLIDRGVTVADIARAMNVTHRAVAARLERRETRENLRVHDVGSDGVVAVV